MRTRAAACVLAGIVFIAGALTWSVLGGLRLRAADPAEGAATIAAQRPGEPGEARRRRGELMAIGRGLERERESLEREKRDLATLRDAIERRRQQFPEGLPPAAAAADQFDVMVYNHRLERFHASVADFNARAARYRADVEAFIAQERASTGNTR